jgi:GntR family transcriptional regulator
MNAALPLPKYHQVYLVLREKLQDGLFADGVPPEIALAKDFGVGRITVRRALEQLAEEGMITREPGRGTRPVQGHGAGGTGFFEQSGKSGKSRLTGLLENLVSVSLKTSVRVLELRRIGASESVAEALHIAPGARVQKAVRVRSSKDGPLSHITTYVPDALASGFSRRELASKPILLLLEESGVEVGRVRQTVSARQADAAVAASLEVAVGTALLAVRRLVFDVQDRPVQWLHGLYRPDRYQYQMEMSQAGTRIWVEEDFPA